MPKIGRSRVKIWLEMLWTSSKCLVVVVVAPVSKAWKYLMTFGLSPNVSKSRLMEKFAPEHAESALFSLFMTKFDGVCAAKIKF